MSILVMSMVWAGGPVAPHLKLMLLAVADNANDKGVAWPSVATLAAKCSVQERAAQRTLAALAADGWLTVEERPGRSNFYRVNMTRLRGVVDDTPVADDTPVVDDTPTPVVHDTPPPSSTTPEPSMNHQGNRHTHVEDFEAAFEEFWQAYPKRVDKQAARRAYRTSVVLARVDPMRVILEARRYAEQVAQAHTEPKFIKHPSTWLRATDFTDPPEFYVAIPVSRPGRLSGNDAVQQSLALVQRLQAQETQQIGATRE